MTVADEGRRLNGLKPARFTSLYRRDEPSKASLQIQAEMGATGSLTTPTNIIFELNDWIDIYRTMFAEYVPDTKEHHGLPSFARPRFVTHLPSELRYYDPRPIVMDGQYLDQIGDRLVDASAHFDNLPADANDQEIVISALHAISAYMTKQIKEWYLAVDLPIRKSCEVSELVDMKDRIKKELFV